MGFSSGKISPNGAHPSPGPDLRLLDLYLSSPNTLTHMFSAALFHNNYMIVLGNEHMAVDLESSSALCH